MKKIKQTDTRYGDYIISLVELHDDEFMIEAWHKSQQSESDTTPAIVVDGSFNNSTAAYLFMGETIAKAEL